MKLPDGMRVELGPVENNAVQATVIVDEVTHRCPPEGSGTMPCCGRTPFEVPRWHRMTLDPELVTCGADRSRW